jgi:Fe-S-cluster containining protein
MGELKPQRPCGDCALCCKILPIDTFDGEDDGKPAGQWCHHWSKQTGCSIYEERYEVCHIFHCFWALGLIPEELKPNKTKTVLAMYKEEVLIVYCDPAYPDAWEKGNMGTFLMNWPEKFVLQIGDNRSVIYPKGVLE